MSNLKQIVEQVKEKKRASFFSKLGGIVDNYWNRWIELRKEGYDVRVKNVDEFKVDFSSLKIPNSFKVENLDEIANYVVIPKVEIPKTIKIENLAELAKYFKVKEVIVPNEFSIKNLKDIPKIEFPQNLKDLSFEKSEKLLLTLAKEIVALKNKKVSDEVFIKNKKPTESIPVRIVDKRGKDFAESIGGGGFFPSKIGIFNKAVDSINPATEEKQDAIVTAIENIEIAAPVGGATEAKQLPDGHEVEVNNLPTEYPLPSAQVVSLTPPVQITGFATSAKQLADNHQVAVSNFPASQPISGTIAISNPTTNPETGLATSSKQDTLSELVETLQELNARLTVLTGMANAGAPALRTIPIASVSTAVTGSVTATVASTVVSSLTNFGTGVPASEVAHDMNNLLVTIANINNAVSA